MKVRPCLPVSRATEVDWSSRSSLALTRLSVWTHVRCTAYNVRFLAYTCTFMIEPSKVTERK